MYQDFFDEQIYLQEIRLFLLIPTRQAFAAEMHVQTRAKAKRDY